MWGDDLGIITMYNFMKPNWHICSYKNYKKPDRTYLDCHAGEIIKNYDEALMKTDAMREAKEWNQWFEGIAKELNINEA